MSMQFKEIDVRLAVFEKLADIIIAKAPVDAVSPSLDGLPERGEKIVAWVLNGEPAEVAEGLVAPSKKPFGGKPTVQYDQRGARIVVGQQASVFAVDHYSGVIGPTTWVTTSTVLSYDAATGAFETRNTKYVPL